MNITTIKTAKIRPGDMMLAAFLDAYIPELAEGSVVAIASKIVAICEGSVAPLQGTDKEKLIEEHTSHYLPAATNPYGVTLSITQNILVVAGGIDESNSGDYFTLWPKDKQASANTIREHLAKKFALQNVGVVITDSTTRPLQWGTTGLGIAYSGFAPLKDYIGTKDIFGRVLQYHKNNIMNGLAAAAVVVMGEGSEQTPLAIIRDVPFVDFQSRNPTSQELEALKITIEEDVYTLLLKGAPWKRGRQQS